MKKIYEKKTTIRFLGIPFFAREYFSVWQRDIAADTALAQPEPVEVPDDEDGDPIFVVSSMLLHECYHALTRTAEEDLHAVTGSVVGRIRTLERIVPVALSSKSIVGATADDISHGDALIMLYEWGLRPLAYFHSHPGHGAGATTPSGTDRRTQDQIEASATDIIGAIFARDGFVRFFANRRDPDVQVVGKRIHEVERNVYKLENCENIQMPLSPR